MTAAATVRTRLGLNRREFLWGLLVVDVQVLLAAVYPALPNVGTISNPLILVFPLVWIDVGLWAIVTTEPSTSSPRTKYFGLVIGGAYFIVLAYVGGVITPGYAFVGQQPPFLFRWAWPLPPGWGPALLYAGKWVGLHLVPYKVVGYVTLAYLVYATVLDAAGSALAGAIGLFSCVSCTLPVIGMVAAGLFGSASAVAAVALNRVFLLSTLVFLASVALLRWRPSFEVVQQS